MKSNSEYRRLAYDLVKGKVLNIFLFSLVLGLIVGVVSAFGQQYAPVVDFETMVIVKEGNLGMQQLFNLISIVLLGYVTYAMTKMYVGVSKNEQPSFERDLFSGVKEQPIKAPVLTLATGFFLALWSLLFVIPGIVKNYSYSMSTYVLVHEKDLGPLDAITKSRHLMNGHKLDLFLLDLSYLGWYFLSLFTFGILLIWVLPRHQTARTLFFADVYSANV